MQNQVRNSFEEHGLGVSAPQRPDVLPSGDPGGEGTQRGVLGSPPAKFGFGIGLLRTSLVKKPPEAFPRSTADDSAELWGCSYLRQGNCP
jgi:hypothetical protein